MSSVFNTKSMSKILYYKFWNIEIDKKINIVGRATSFLDEYSISIRREMSNLGFPCYFYLDVSFKWYHRCISVFGIP